MENPNPGEISSFYDEYLSRQLRTAYNERQLFLVQQLRGLGLDADSSVLEIGCGAGVVTSLVTEIVSRGRVVAVDLSPASVEIAKRLNSSRPNVTFLVGEMASLEASELGTFDFVLLFDILEHIPMADHARNIAILRAKTAPSSRVVVNIPSPQYNAYLRAHEPASLQVVDEVLESDFVLSNFANSGLVLDSFKTYGVWLRDQYQLMVFRPRSPLDPSRTDLIAVPRQPILRRIIRRLALRRVLRSAPKG